MERTSIRYSEAFKRQVVEELERGKHASLETGARAYGIRGRRRCRKWVRKYGREDLLPKRVRIETLKERDELKEARKRIRELEAAVADAHIDHCLEKAYFHVACERMGVDPDDFKKKNAMTLSELRKSSRKEGDEHLPGLCKSVGMSRQNFYKSAQGLVSARRLMSSGEAAGGGRACGAASPGWLEASQHASRQLAAEDVNLGRDRFFEVLRNQALLLEPLPKAPRTTNSAHSLPVFTNLVKDLEVTGPNQVWVSDITYIRTREDFAYLSLITDKYSRKIVGYHLAQTLGSSGYTQSAQDGPGAVCPRAPAHPSFRSRLPVLLPRVRQGAEGPRHAGEHDRRGSLRRECLGRAYEWDPEAGVLSEPRVPDRGAGPEGCR